MAELVTIIICIILNALLSLVEMAFVAVGRAPLKKLVREGNKEAKRILALRDNPERTLSVLQIGITLVGALAAATGGAGIEDGIRPFIETHLGVTTGVAEAMGIIIVVVPLTYLSVIIGELLPKTIALRNPLGVILHSGRWLAIADKFLEPIVTLFEWSTKRLLGLFFRRTKPEEQAALAEGLDIEHLSQQHRQYVLNLVNIEKKQIRDIMVPWEQVIAIGIHHSIEEVRNAILESGHTRLPVLEGEQVLGILHAKEFMAFRSSGRENWQSLLRPVIELQAYDSLLRALKVMQERRSRMSVVFSQKQRIGIVTLEDIIEEIIGEVFDEDDDGAIRRLLSTGPLLRSSSPTLEPFKKRL